MIQPRYFFHYVYKCINILKTLYWQNIASFLFTCESDKYTFTVKNLNRISLEEQWIRIHLPKQRTRVQSLLREDSTYNGATRPLCHNYWACTPKSPHTSTIEAPLPITCALPEKPVHHSKETPPLAETRESPCAATKTQCNQKIQTTQMWSTLSASSCHAHPTLPDRDHCFHLVAPPSDLPVQSRDVRIQRVQLSIKTSSRGNCFSFNM